MTRLRRAGPDNATPASGVANRRRMKIVITCADGHHYPIERNKGAEAVLLTTAALLRETFPSAGLVTPIQCSERVFRAAGWRVLQSRRFTGRVFSPRTTLAGTYRLLSSLLSRHLPGDPDTLPKRALLDRITREYATADLIVHAGMDLVSDDFGFIAIVEHCQDLLLGVVWRRPVVLWAESIGPFRSRISRALVCFVLGRAAAPLLRETDSLAVVRSLGIPPERVYLTADPAFLLETQGEPQLSATAPWVKGTNEVRIGLCLNLGYLAGGVRSDREVNLLRDLYRWGQYLLPETLFAAAIRAVTRTGFYTAPRRTEAAYVRGMVALVDELLSAIPCIILLIPHVESFGLLVNEHELHVRVREECSRPDRVTVCGADDGAAATKAVIGTCDLFIGGRMHANIAALSQCIPTIGVSYSHKFRGIMRDLGQEEYVTDLFAPDEVSALAKRALRESDSIRRVLAERLPEMKRRARQNAAICKRLLDKD